MAPYHKNDDTMYYSSSSGVAREGGANTTVVKSRCYVQEVARGRFIRKCVRTEEILKDCVGRPSETVAYNHEYDETDVTDQMVKTSFPSESAEAAQSTYFPGLCSDIKALRHYFAGEVGRLSGTVAAIQDEFSNLALCVPTEPPKEDLPKNDNTDSQVAAGV